MCEYTYENGKKCRLKPLEGSKYCALHIPREEGEALYGEKIKEIKREAFERRLKTGQTYFEGVDLYDVAIKDYTNEKFLVFKNSTITNLITDASTVKGIILINSKIERVVIFESTLETVLVKNSTIFGLNILRTEFSSHIAIRESEVKYLMINSTRYTPKEEKGEDKAYGETERIVGNIEISNLTGVRRIGINTRYPLLREILKEHGINVSESKERSVRARNLIIRDVSFDVSPRYKRRVRLTVAGFHGRLHLENLEVFGHVEIRRSYLVSPEFVHVKVESNLILRNSSIHTDSTWNMTVLPNLLIELEVGGFVIVEDCRFNSPRAEELFYRLARTSWEKSGDFDRADEYYYLEMLAKRKAKLQSRKRGLKKLINTAEVWFEWLFADLTCKYGTDWKRPILLWLAAVNVFFPLLFWATKSVEGLSNSLSFLDYEYFSIVTATTLGYGDYHPFGVGRIIASVEALFGMFMWAVFLTVFARKYMR
ncbi:MAG: hypothetical protein PWQ79_1939 [Thermococcaceae archaeon]|nr:hypothetical protein [Thermococcaceae archaeon]MDK2915024.1 hypothetical protein [Thermococcaceae archaeon]